MLFSPNPYFALGCFRRSADRDCPAGVVWATVRGTTLGEEFVPNAPEFCQRQRGGNESAVRAPRRERRYGLPVERGRSERTWQD